MTERQEAQTDRDGKSAVAELVARRRAAVAAFMRTGEDTPEREAASDALTAVDNLLLAADATDPCDMALQLRAAPVVRATLSAAFGAMRQDAEGRS